jgi:hypothetical protein
MDGDILGVARQVLIAPRGVIETFERSIERLLEIVLGHVRSCSHLNVL